MIKIKLL